MYCPAATAVLAAYSAVPLRGAAGLDMVINFCEHAEKDLCGKKHKIQPLGGNGTKLSIP